MPLNLVGELGWGGMFDEAVRLAARRLLARVGPARLTRQRAVVIFAQNQDTARLMGIDDGRLRVLSNATSVDVREIHPTGTRRKRYRARSALAAVERGTTGCSLPSLRPAPGRGAPHLWRRSGTMEDCARCASMGCRRPSAVRGSRGP